MVLSILLIVASPLNVWALGEIGSFPFKAGERCLYEIRWGVIPAGRAELLVLPITDVNGIPAWHFQLSIRTNEFVDVFYKVRDKIDSYAALAVSESLYYRKSQQEGRSLREEVVSFDTGKNSASYSNYDKISPPISLMPGTVDPLTAVFFIRTQSLREHLDIVKPITDGKKNVSGVAKVLQKESLEVDGITYDTFRVEPDLREVGGVFEKSAKSRITLWFTTDERHLLVKIEGKVVVGAFTGTLLDRGRAEEVAVQ
ncbi:MAG: DUF3108 domain-containing protein [Desulfobulbaceae bacterium]|nr:DUF3108 domain-containing protein [Desulfobulbaceae bacterium]